MIIILIGPPGSGKSTQAKLIAQKLGVPSVSMGQVLRNAKDAQTILGLEANRFMEEGELVPTKMMEAFTKLRLGEEDCEDGFILDGAPRRVEEAVMLNDYLDKEGKKIDYVFQINVPSEEVVKRLLSRSTLPKAQGGGRKDDNIEDIKVRLAEYRDHIEAVNVYFKEKEILHLIDGVGTIEEIFQRIAAVLQL